MTYRELAAEILNTLTDEQLDMDVTIYDSEDDEFFGCYSNILGITTAEDNVLDKNHPYLPIKM